MNKSFILANGTSIPTIGFGTWKSPEGDLTSESVIKAIECGYRIIDGAALYKNEKSVGIGIKNSGIAREELFITSKVWKAERPYDKAIAAFEKTLSDLQLDYLDLYLIHWPASAKNYENWDEVNKETWQALIDLHKKGLIKAIGVSNFRPHHLESLMKMEIVPMVNQIEFHPGYLQAETVEYCHKNNIVVEGWRPLGAGKLLENEILVEIAKKYNASSAQICIAWSIAHGVLPLPKSVTPSRIKQNLEAAAITLTAEDIALIDTINTCILGDDPDEVVE